MKSKKIIPALAIVLLAVVGTLLWFRPKTVILPENCRLMVDTGEESLAEGMWIEDPEQKAQLLELLSIYLGEVLELDILMGKNISMSRTERTAIMEAKRIIDSQLAFAPSCEELSQQVHLSLTKLTRGFSSFYGMPIHQYVIEQRLTQAAQLLLDGDWNVGEVAAIVGYGKPSNFAAAFKKKYGVAPKHYRETRFNHTKQ